VKKDTPPASPRGEYLFTGSKQRDPKEDCIMLDAIFFCQSLVNRALRH
jgi:hypothetical protein